MESNNVYQMLWCFVFLYVFVWLIYSAAPPVREQFLNSFQMPVRYEIKDMTMC